MATDYPAMPNNDMRRFYRGPNPQGSLGDHVRAMVMEGRQVAQGEKMRWEENREFFRGNQWIRIAPDQRTITALSRNLIVPSGRPGHNAYNRYRANINARVSLMTKERPPYEVAPEDNDSDSLDAARQAEKFISARWGRTGWNIKHAQSELAKNGDIDGLAWLSVAWDPYAGGSKDQWVATKADGSRFTGPFAREEFEAAKAADPEMRSLWRMSYAPEPLGDISWRVVLPAAMSVDPFAVKSFDKARWCCESRIVPRADVERRMGVSFKDIVASARNEDADQVQYEDMAIEGGGKMSERSGVVVHFFYAVPQPDWPDGVFLEFLDRAPQRPLSATEWKDALPYFPYTPSPDPGHFVRSRGVGDDLKPIQRDYNQTLRDLRLWLNKVATSPVMIPVNSLRSKSFFNEEGYAEYFAAQGEPRQGQVPSEPTAVFTNNLQWMAMEMERVSGVSSLSQGFSMPNGPEATSGIQMQLQQTEQNLSETEHNLVDAIEWGVNRSLDLVRQHYTVARTVTGVGVDDAEQFKAFTGAMLRGGRFRVTGPLMPKSKAARMQSIMQFGQMFGDQLAPYAAQLIDGDPTEFMRDAEVVRQYEKGAIRELMALLTDPKAQAVYQRFEEDKQRFAEGLKAAQQQAAVMGQQQQQMATMLEQEDPETGQDVPMPAPGPIDPMQLLASRGILPPNLTQSLQDAGVRVPMVNIEHDNHFIAQKVCNDWRMGDAYKALPEMGKQLLLDRMNAHTQGMQRQVQAMAQQQPMGQQAGSQPNPRGTPSPPKAKQPGGA